LKNNEKKGRLVTSLTVEDFMVDKNQTVLITGGAGFIGSNLADALLEERHEVAIIDNLSTGRKENIPNKAKFYEIDITQKGKLEEVFEKVKPEAIFHLAAQASVNRSVKDPINDVKVNVIGTINLLELAQKYEVGHFIFSSTGGAIYGDNTPRPTPETAEADPVTPYGIDKLHAESFIGFFSKNTDCKTVILRYANVYGPRQDPLGEAGVIAIFASKMLSGEPVIINGDGEQTRDFVFVKDVVRANLAALKSDQKSTYNIGSGKEISINELAERLKQITASKSEIAHGPAKIEQKNSCLDIERARLDLDFEPITDMLSGLKQTIDSLK
jgi:UDP-glucose 4-epimerase